MKKVYKKDKLFRANFLNVSYATAQHLAEFVKKSGDVYIETRIFIHFTTFAGFTPFL